jgi:type II secretory pathway pseudopilin PulG
MTIIEVLFAIVILSGVMLSMSRFGQSFTRASRNAANVATASDLATGRLQVVQSHPTYATIVSTFHSTTETSAGAANPSMTGYPGFTRTTKAVRTNTATGDFVTVTVTITSSILQRPIAKTAIIAAFQ